MDDIRLQRQDVETGAKIDVHIGEIVKSDSDLPYRDIWFHYHGGRLFHTLFYAEIEAGESERSLSCLGGFHSVCAANLKEESVIKAADAMIERNAIPRICHYFDGPPLAP